MTDRKGAVPVLRARVTREVLVSDQPRPSEVPAQTPVQGRPLGVLVAAGVLVAIPVVALMWVGSYARETPRLWGMPFFYWYQFLWVFLAAGCTYAAYRVVLATTPRRRFGQTESGNAERDRLADDGGER